MSYQFTAVSLSYLPVPHVEANIPAGAVFARDADGHWFIWQMGLDQLFGVDDVSDPAVWPINDDGTATLFRDHWRHFAHSNPEFHGPLHKAALGANRVVISVKRGA